MTSKATRWRHLAAALLITVLVCMLTGCDREGPADQTEQNIDESVEHAGRRLHEFGQEIEESARNG